MKKAKYLALSLVLIFSASCSKPTIDTSSGIALEDSVDLVSESLPENEQDNFARAIVYISTHNSDYLEPAFKRKEKLNGMSGTQVIEYYKELRIKEENAINGMNALRSIISGCWQYFLETGKSEVTLKELLDEEAYVSESATNWIEQNKYPLDTKYTEDQKELSFKLPNGVELKMDL